MADVPVPARVVNGPVRDAPLTTPQSRDYSGVRVGALAAGADVPGCGDDRLPGGGRGLGRSPRRQPPAGAASPGPGRRGVRRGRRAAPRCRARVRRAQRGALAHGACGGGARPASPVAAFTAGAAGSAGAPPSGGRARRLAGLQPAARPPPRARRHPGGDLHLAPAVGVARRAGEADSPRRAACAVHPPVRGGFLWAAWRAGRVRRPPAGGRAGAGDARASAAGAARPRAAARLALARGGVAAARNARRGREARRHDSGPEGSAGRRPRSGPGAGAWPARGRRGRAGHLRPAPRPRGLQRGAGGLGHRDVGVRAARRADGGRVPPAPGQLPHGAVSGPGAARGPRQPRCRGRRGAGAGAGCLHARGAGPGGRRCSWGARASSSKPASPRCGAGLERKAPASARHGPCWQWRRGPHEGVWPTPQVHETTHRLGPRGGCGDDRCGDRLGLHGVPPLAAPRRRARRQGRACAASATVPRRRWRRSRRRGSPRSGSSRRCGCGSITASPRSCAFSPAMRWPSCYSGSSRSSPRTSSFTWVTTPSSGPASPRSRTFGTG